MFSSCVKSTVIHRRVEHHVQPAGLNAADLKTNCVSNLQLFLYLFLLQRQRGCVRWQLDALLNIKMLSKALIFKLCIAVTPWIGIEVSWVVTQGGSS